MDPLDDKMNELIGALLSVVEHARSSEESFETEKFRYETVATDKGARTGLYLDASIMVGLFFGRRRLARFSRDWTEIQSGNSVTGATRNKCWQIIGARQHDNAYSHPESTAGTKAVVIHYTVARLEWSRQQEFLVIWQ